MRTGINRLYGSIVIMICFGLPVLSHSQYILNGNATQNSCNCYTLTQAVNWQAGSVWNATKIDLSRPFDYVFNVYLGCQDANGADGIVFMLQPVSTSLGTGGGGMGFQGVTPSIGITLDTWQNTEFNDPAYDHISIQANGVIAHGTDLAGPTQASSTSANIEDCAWHTFRISWDPATFFLRGYFDGSLRVEISNNLVANIFNNDPMVYWGFSSATGGSNNLQQFCTALNPDFNTNFTTNATCIGTPVVFTDQSQSFAPIQSWLWEFGDGQTSNMQTPPPHMYAQAGVYDAKLTITGLDGCVSTPITKTVTIGSKPVADFEAFDTCFGKRPRFIDQSTSTIGAVSEWSWYMDGSLISTSQVPNLPGIAAGNHDMKLVVRSVYNCESDTAYGSFAILPRPLIDASVMDGCAGQLLQFNAQQIDNVTVISNWNWNFGDGQTGSTPNTSHAYTNSGQYSTTVWAMGNNGCASDTLINPVTINQVTANAGRDTMILKGVPFKLLGSASPAFPTPSMSYSWSPPVNLDNPMIATPIATLNDDITYELRVTTAEGCTDVDSVKITVFKGSAVYVPTGFTPNNDGKNEILRPTYIGIRQLDYFRVYNRWGQLIFSTNNTGMGWDGTIRGQKQQTGTFVWMVKAIDYAGKVYELKGTTTLIR